MSVNSILEEKGSHVVTSGPHMLVSDACKVLHEHHIGALVIVDGDRRIQGIFTERDIVASIAEHGMVALAQPVESFMWTNVHRCKPTTGINTLMEMMNTLRARHLPVEKDGRLVGIISIGDAVKHHVRAIECEAEYIRSYIAG